MDDGKESNRRVKARERFAHIEMFKSSKKCADHIHDNKPQEIYQKDFYWQQEKNVREHLCAFVSRYVLLFYMSLFI